MAGASKRTLPRLFSTTTCSPEPNGRVGQMRPLRFFAPTITVTLPDDLKHFIAEHGLFKGSPRSVAELRWPLADRRFIR